MKLLSMSLALKVIILQIQYQREKVQSTLSPLMSRLENATIGSMLITGFHQKEHP